MKYRLRLKKALSYTGVLSATKKEPIVCTDDKDIADAAVATGYFDLLDAVEDEAEVFIGHLDENQLLELTKQQLQELAAEMGLDISGCKTKTDIAAVIAAEKVTVPAVDSKDAEEGIALAEA